MFSYLELVELPNGDIVLQPAEGDDTPLVTIRFSEESRQQVPGSCLEVARAMIQAGFQAVESMAQHPAEDDYIDEGEHKTLH